MVFLIRGDYLERHTTLRLRYRLVSSSLDHWQVRCTGWQSSIRLGMLTDYRAFCYRFGPSGGLAQLVLLGGLLVFGAVFAVNSSLHSYLILSYAKNDGVSLDVGFYNMSNALGRLIGTLLSGWVHQAHGMVACLWISAIFLLLAALASLSLPKHSQPTQTIACSCQRQYSTCVWSSKLETT